MTVTVIAQISVNEAAPDKLAAYFKVTTPLLARVGAKIVTRFDVHETVIGQGGAKSIVVVEYPDREAVLNVFNSPEYQSIKKLRDEAFYSYQISICETMSTEPTQPVTVDQKISDGVED